MPVHPTVVPVTTDLAVTVSIGASGTLADGVADRLDRIDGVTAVDTVSITGLSPRMNDTVADVTAELAVDIEDARGDPVVGATEVLEDGVGVREVAAVDLRDKSSEDHAPV